LHASLCLCISHDVPSLLRLLHVIAGAAQVCLWQRPGRPENTNRPACLYYLIVCICPRIADKISGGRSPNDQAFESPTHLRAKPYERWRREIFEIRIQTGRIARR
jgi:hypothetical protein